MSDAIFAFMNTLFFGLCFSFLQLCLSFSVPILLSSRESQSLRLYSKHTIGCVALMEFIC